jgi:formylmethanofuran dehydrogenase subunit A
MSLYLIKGGTLYDPKNNIDGVQEDLWIQDGKIIPTPKNRDTKPDKTYDVRSMVVMPGGVDMHCHIAGPKVNTARKLMPEDKRNALKIERTAITRSGTTGSVPSTFATGYLYAGLGYTTAFDAAVPPLGSRHAHEELQDTPIIDKGFYVLTGNNHYIMKKIQAGEPHLVKSYLAWLLHATGGYGVKVVNPGGVEVWKSTGGNISGMDESVTHFDVTPRQILQAISRSVHEMKLPHAVHIHCNNLGIPGNASTTLETMHALEGARGHITHIQFHSYGGHPDDQSTFCSRVPELADYVNSHDNITVDVGQVMFSKTTSMTGDGPLGYFLHKVTGRKWYSGDTEMEAGCGIVPIEYKNKSFVHSLQWAIGLEWYLLVEDPWKIAMSTDHPNGAAFLAYPEIISLLMDRQKREEVLKTVPQKIRDHCTLADLDREYSLNEIAIITRAAPAKILGLDNKGHLGPGADADITIYNPQEDLQKMFEIPRYVFQAGELVVEDGEIRTPSSGKVFCVRPEYDKEHLKDINSWFDRNYTIQFNNYEIDDDFLGAYEIIPAKKG